MHSFFFLELQLITVLLLIRNLHNVHLSKSVCAFLLKFVFLLNKKYGLFDFKNVIIPFKIKMIKKTSRPRIFKLQREVWKSSDICMG